MSIHISHLSFAYGKNIIFDDLNLTLPDTGFVVILGPSGSGKTTFLSLLSGLLKPDEGKIKGNDVNKSSLVFQSPLLLDYLSVEENVALPLLLQGKTMAEISLEIAPVLANLNLEELKGKYPYHLSGGEQVRVAIARGLIKNGKTLILDEPTGQLDEKNSAAIYQTLKELSHDHLILLVTHDETNGIKLADELYRLEHHTLKAIKKSQPRINKDEKLASSSKKKFSLRNAIFINFRYLLKKKTRTLLSTLFLSFNMMLIYLGINLNTNMTSSINALLQEYYAYEVMNLSMKEEVAREGKLHLTKNSIPDEEVLSILKIKETYYSLSYFLPTYQEVQLNNKAIDTSFYPIIKEETNRLSIGHMISSLEEVVVNESFLEEAGLEKKQALGKKIHIYHQALIYSKQFSSSDNIYINLTFQIVGISKEKKAFNKPCIYYSYSFFSEYLENQYLINISEELEKDLSVFDLLHDSKYDQDDFKANGILTYNKNPDKLEEQVKKIYPDTITISSQALEVKNSTIDIISSLLKVLTLFLVLNTICCLMLEFLVVYSLYADNIRLFALIKTFNRNKKDILKTAFGLQMIFLVLIFLSSLILSLFSTLLTNGILHFFQYPSFLSLLDINSLLFILLISLFCSLIGALLPLRKIKDKDINQELEGED